MASPARVAKIAFLDAVLALVIVTGHEGQIIRVNPACERVLGALKAGTAMTAHGVFSNVRNRCRPSVSRSCTPSEG